VLVAGAAVGAGLYLLRPERAVADPVVGNTLHVDEGP
jgi:hypothetical protein